MTIKVAVLEPAPRYAIDDVKQAMRERLHLLPQFRCRVVKVPLGLQHPVWIEDPAFDLDRHIGAIELPAPGGSREIEGAVSEIASHQLDRRRPLWEPWLLLASATLAARRREDGRESSLQPHRVGDA